MSLAEAVQKVRSLPEKIRRRAAYKNVFSGLDGDYVLKDLYTFCRMGTSELDADPTVLAILAGRRSVFIKILHNMKVHDERKEMKRLEEMRDE